MRTLAWLCVVAAISAASSAFAQTPAPIVQRLDPAFDALVPADTKVEIIYQGDAFFEGPVWHPADGFLTFSDLITNRIVKWDPATKQTSTFVADVWKGMDNSSAIRFERDGKTYVQIGPNGETLDKEGRLVFTAMGSGRIMRREPNGAITVLAQSYEGRHLNAPNDLVYKSDGALYFTDIRAGLVTRDETPPEGVPHTGVYRLKDGVLTLLVNNLDAPNGIAFSPDEKILYVNDIRQRKLMRYDVQADGTLANGRVLVDMIADPRVGNPDGMKVDVRGNIWDGGPGGIWVISPEGKHLGTILTPERISNLAWGDADGMTLYTTGPTMVTRIRVGVAGMRP